MELNRIINENCRNGLTQLPDNSVHCCVTSPPYYGLRDYESSEQIGLEETPELFVQQLVNIFAEVKRVLKPTGTLWLNLGDSFAGSKRTQSFKSELIKPKDLIGVPWMVAFALRANGWYLRQDIIWHKRNPMPESVTDRCTKAHEYIFLLTKNTKYYYDADAIKTDCKNPDGSPKKSGNKLRKKSSERGCPENTGSNVCSSVPWKGTKANKRSVWSVTNKPYPKAHFATFPEELIIDCIKAGCPVGGIVLDPFMGAGTTAVVAKKLGRNYLGFELNPEYVKIANERITECNDRPA